MTRRPRRRVWGVSVETLVVICAISAVTGFAIALVVTHGTGSGNGQHETGALLSYWTETNSTNTTIPTNLTAPSTTVASPTVLAATSKGYKLNSVTVGNKSEDWFFTETTSAPVSTELELNIIVATGYSTQTQHTYKVYLETQSTKPSASLVFAFYFDGSSTTLVAFDWSEEWTDQCASVGSCP